MLTLTYQYKLITTPQQSDEIEWILSVCRQVWNYALGQRKDWLNSRKCQVNACSIEKEYIIPPDAPYPNYNHQAKQLTEAKKTNPELKSVNAQVLQQVLKTLDRAFNEMKTQRRGFPRFKNKYRMRSFVFPQFKTNPIRNDWIKLPQLGWIKMRLSRPIPNGFKLKQVRIVRRASGYFIILSLSMDVSVPDVLPSGHPLGIDIGLEKYLATSDGELVERPRFLFKLQRKLKLLQRRLKHKKKGSNNRHKLNQKIARLHQKISETRKDFHFKLAHHLCDQAGSIFVEDIDFKAWAKGMLRKHTLDAGFGQFFNILAWVCWKRGVYFDKVDKNYTSQICPNCGTKTGKKELSQRIHKCRECGLEINRDVAAAKVICARGLTAVGQIVVKNVCGGDESGTSRKICLDGSWRSRKPKA